MKDLKKKVLKAIGKVAETGIKNVDSSWPPACIGYIYQPKRPKKKD